MPGACKALRVAINGFAWQCFQNHLIKSAIEFIASCLHITLTKSINNAGNPFILPNKKLLSCIWFWLCIAAFQTAGADTKPAPTSTEPTDNVVGSAASTVTRWTCNAFYLPARNIWQRIVAIKYEGDVVRSVQIDGVAVHTFTLGGTSLLTSVDGERIQFDVAALTWISDLRSLASSTGRCTL